MSQKTTILLTTLILMGLTAVALAPGASAACVNGRTDSNGDRYCGVYWNNNSSVFGAFVCAGYYDRASGNATCSTVIYDGSALPEILEVE